MSDRTVTRREVIRLLLASAVAVPAAAIMGCSKKEGGGGLTCTDTAGLTEQEVGMRKTMQYVDKSPDAVKKCSGCALYKAAAAAGSCGGCQLLKGPIHPDGYCTSFAAKPT